MAVHAPSSTSSGRTRPFDIDVAVTRIEEAIRPLPKAALFQLAEDGYDTVFEQLVACIISIRTRDEVMLPTACRLFERARTPVEISQLGVAAIDDLIRACTFHERKAHQIQQIAATVAEQHDGVLPCDAEIVLSFEGVGPKCANLVLGVACGQEFIGVDVHVHRVTNRWGYVRTTTPETTIGALAEKLPRQYWIDINRLLVPFGKHICTGRLPRCSTCPVLEMCAQVGVDEHR